MNKENELAGICPDCQEFRPVVVVDGKIYIECFCQYSKFIQGDFFEGIIKTKKWSENESRNN